MTDMGPNQQAIVAALKDRPARIIAQCTNGVQHTFAGLFDGAQTPAKFDSHGKLNCGNVYCNAGWPAAWNALVARDLITYEVWEPPVIVDSQHRNAYASLHWQITALGWEVRIDDLAWMMEFRAATDMDKATRQ
jgi:hypothetical protein